MPGNQSGNIHPELENSLRGHLTQYSDIQAAYVFGSRASGSAREDSDIDVAILLSPKDDTEERFSRRLELTRTLNDHLAPKVDVVILNDAPPLLQQEVIRNGRIICDHDRNARIDFEVRVGKINADLRPAREFYRNAMFDELRKEGLGGQR